MIVYYLFIVTALIYVALKVAPVVDAPLDDANVGRFNEMLKGMSDLSQFIVITHNKLTMTMADRLYGITMEEPGMTKLVAVDLESGDQADAA